MGSSRIPTKNGLAKFTAQQATDQPHMQFRYFLLTLVADGGLVTEKEESLRETSGDAFIATSSSFLNRNRRDDDAEDVTDEGDDNGEDDNTADDTFGDGMTEDDTEDNTDENDDTGDDTVVVDMNDQDDATDEDDNAEDDTSVDLSDDDVTDDDDNTDENENTDDDAIEDEDDDNSEDNGEDGDFVYNNKSTSTKPESEPYEITVNDMVTGLCLILILFLIFHHFRNETDGDDDGHYYDR